MRCANCDRPLATQADHDTIAEGDGEHLCWSRYSSACESIDWRARALEARAERDAIARQLAALREAAAGVMLVLNECSECPVCGNDGCSDVDEENNHVAGDACAALWVATGNTAAAAQAHDDAIRAPLLSQIAALHAAASEVVCDPCPFHDEDDCDETCREGNQHAGLRAAVADTVAAAEAHDREVRARVWEEADALLDAEGPGRVYHERLLRARAAEERGR